MSWLVNVSTYRSLERVSSLTGKFSWLCDHMGVMGSGKGLFGPELDFMGFHNYLFPKSKHFFFVGLIYQFC